MHWLTASLALLLSLSVSADPLSVCLEESGGVTVNITDCLSEELARQEERLNAAYREALSKVAGENQERLRAAQRLWIRYRDAACDFLGNLTGGSVDSIRQLECLLRETAHRANELEAQPS